MISIYNGTTSLGQVRTTLFSFFFLHPPSSVLLAEDAFRQFFSFGRVFYLRTDRLLFFFFLLNVRHVFTKFNTVWFILLCDGASLITFGGGFRLWLFDRVVDNVFFLAIKDVLGCGNGIPSIKFRFIILVSFKMEFCGFNYFFNG